MGNGDPPDGRTGDGVAPGTVRFTNTRFQRGKAIILGFVALMLVLMLQSMAHRVNSVVLVYMAMVVCALLVVLIGVVRCFFMGITLSDRGITVQTAYTTKTYPWDTLERVEAVERLARGAPTYVSINRASTAPGEGRMHVLGVLWLRNGKRVPLTGLRVTSASSDSPSSFIDDAMREAQRRIKERGALG